MCAPPIFIPHVYIRCVISCTTKSSLHAKPFKINCLLHIISNDTHGAYNTQSDSFNTNPGQTLEDPYALQQFTISKTPKKKKTNKHTAHKSSSRHTIFAIRILVGNHQYTATWVKIISKNKLKNLYPPPLTLYNTCSSAS